ncbi:methyltransferase domain-containing protein [bacterium]|nr:methyltransferase domain-containing protein [bacterium]NCQ55215.1 methyltransferase domain-containing protein [Candidatus Parcubacteria bacterium]NCS67272.1 methyltransferase domain-containing protein [Candidatus Peregrinibacteria bacterium]NCS96527.1 methyltransferase domain-containing protein [bacterium]
MSEYDKFAENWDKTRVKPWPEFDVFFPLIQKGDRLLDLGCGNGRLRQFLPNNLVRSGDYFGFDLSVELLKIARQNHPRDSFFKGDFSTPLPFGADNFDWVVSIAAFHHLLEPSAQKVFLNEVYRVLKPGGKVFLTTWVLPKKYFWMNFWRGRVFTKNWIVPFGKEKHVRTYRYVNENDLKGLLTKAGFVVEKAERFEERNFIILASKSKKK